MGFPMAGNLVKGGVEVSAFDMNASAVKMLEKEGAVAVDGLSGIAQQTTVITMLPAGWVDLLWNWCLIVCRAINRLLCYIFI